jgi:hypothetical protein
MTIERPMFPPRREFAFRIVAGNRFRQARAALHVQSVLRRDYDLMPT